MLSTDNFLSFVVGFYLDTMELNLIFTLNDFNDTDVKINLLNRHCNKIYQLNAVVFFCAIKFVNENHRKILK